MNRLTHQLVLYSETAAREGNCLDADRLRLTFYDRVWPHRADVLRVARFLCRDPSVADDLAQETLLKAFRSLGTFSGGRNAKPWLLAILRNTWTDRLRATKADVSTLDRLEEEPVAATPVEAGWAGGRPEDLLDAFSDQQVIDALQRLPAEIRWTLLLVDVEGLGVQAAADTLGVPAGTIKSRAHRGRAMLRQSLLPLAVDRRLVTGVGGADILGAGQTSEPK